MIGFTPPMSFSRSLAKRIKAQPFDGCISLVRIQYGLFCVSSNAQRDYLMDIVMVPPISHLIAVIISYAAVAQLVEQGTILRWS